MFFEYAVDPAVLKDWTSVRYFLDAFSPWRGRFLAEYPRHWRKAVYDALNCRDAEKKLIEVRLSKMDPRVFIRRRGVYDSAKAWLTNAIEEHDRQPFRAILSSTEDRAKQTLNAETVDDTEPLWRFEQGKLVPRLPKAFCEALGLLLRLSSRVLVVDPYFRPEREKIEMLSELASMLPARATLNIHVRLDQERDPSPEHFVSECRKWLSKKLAAELEVYLHPLGQRENGERLHNRYLITDIAGVQLGDGIESGGEGENDRLSILDEASWRQLWDQFEQPEKTFTRCCPPSRLASP